MEAGRQKWGDGGVEGVGEVEGVGGWGRTGGGGMGAGFFPHNTCFCQWLCVSWLTTTSNNRQQSIFKQLRHEGEEFAVDSLLVYSVEREKWTL